MPAIHYTAIPSKTRAYNPKISRRNNDHGTAKTLTGFGTFIMTIDRTLFLIRNGIVEAIRPDSGHYQPTGMNMALLLQALAMYGVRPDRVKLYDFEGELLGDGLNPRYPHLAGVKEPEAFYEVLLGTDGTPCGSRLVPTRLWRRESRGCGRQ